VSFSVIVIARRPFNCIVMHSDNQLVAVGSWDATVKLYDTFNKTRKAVSETFRRWKCAKYVLAFSIEVHT